MATNDLLNLQGTNPYLQGGTNPQTTYNPQTTVSPQGSLSPTPLPQQPLPAPAPTSPQIGTGASVQAAQPTQLNSLFSPYIANRPSSVNPNVLEYYRTDTGQGFSDQPSLFQYASQLGFGQVSSLDQLHAPVQQAQTQSYSTTQPQPTPSDPYQQIAQGAGNAGLSIDDLTKIAQANSALTPDEIAQIRQSLGIDQIAQTAFTPPAQSTVDLFNQAYQSAGLGDLKSKVQDLSSQIAQAQNDYAEAVAGNNENPFLTENARVGRQSVIANEAQQKIGNLQQEQQNLNDLYTQGLTEANAFVTRYTNDFNVQQQLAAARLDYLNQQAQSIAQAALAQKEQQTLYRYLPDYLTAVQKAQQPFGSAQYGYFKYNPQTKSYEQVSGPAPQFQSNPATGDLFNTSNGQPPATSLSEAFGAAPAQTGNAANLPQRNNNPGDLTNPSTGQFMVFTTPQAGWNALVNDIQAKISGNNAHGLGPTSTLQDFANVYDPASPGSTNNPAQYAATLASQLGVSPTSTIGSLSGRVQDLAVAIANNEGYFAGSTAPGTTGGNLVSQAAQALVDGTAAPSQYSKRGAIYQTILNTATQLSLQQKGVPFNAQNAETAFQNKQAVQPILDNEQSAEAHLNTVLQLSAQFDRGETPVENAANLKNAQYLSGNTAANDYLTAITDTQGEIAKVLSGGGVPSDQDQLMAADLLNPALGPVALASQINIVRTLLQQKVQAYTNPSNLQVGTASSNQSALPVSSSPVDISDINFSF